MAWYDYVPYVSNAVGIKNGDWKQALGGAAYKGGQVLKTELGYNGLPQQPTANEGSADDPNVAYQARENFRTGRDFLGRMPQNDAARAQNGQQTQALLGSLQNTINNPGAPSVASAQLTAGNDMAARQAMGSAAGAQGPNAFAARRQALNAIAQGGIGRQQNAAMLRGAEVASAQNQTGNILGRVDTSNNARRGQDIGAAGHFLGQAGTMQGAHQGLNLKIAADERDQDKAWGAKLIDTGKSFLGPTG